MLTATATVCYITLLHESSSKNLRNYCCVQAGKAHTPTKTWWNLWLFFTLSSYNHKQYSNFSAIYLCKNEDGHYGQIYVINIEKGYAQLHSSGFEPESIVHGAGIISTTPQLPVTLQCYTGLLKLHTPPPVYFVVTWHIDLQVVIILPFLNLF